MERSRKPRVAPPSFKDLCRLFKNGVSQAGGTGRIEGPITVFDTKYHSTTSYKDPIDFLRQFGFTDQEGLYRSVVNKTLYRQRYRISAEI